MAQGELTGSDTKARGAPARLFAALGAAAPALQSRNFRIFWFGQIVSVVGTAMQVLAEGWLVYSITQSTFWLGMVPLLALIPAVPISFVGGLLIDRMPRRKLLLITQSLLLAQAALFGLLATLGVMRLWHIIALYFVFGAVLAVDHPARRAFLVELVDEPKLANAVALNATVFNMSSLIGYAVAGFLIAAIGAGPAMLLNAATYGAPIAALIWIRVADRQADAPASAAPDGDKRAGKRAGMGSALLAGFHTLLERPSILLVMTVMAVAGGLANPVFGLMPAFAEEVLRTNAVGLGYLMAAGALGSVLGTVVVARYGAQNRGRTLLLTAAMLPLLVSLFSMSRSLWVACMVLVFVGIFLLIVQSLAITLVQVHIPDRVRGRVMSIYSQAHAGSDTLGNVFVGSLAVYTGLPLALTLGAGVAMLWVLLVYGVTPLVRRLS